MQRLRTFIAVEVSSDVIGRAQKLIQQLTPLDDNVRWADPRAFHLTLSFLGDVELLELPKICQAMRTAVGELPPFDVVVHGAGAFPSVDRPRTIWLGIREGRDELRAMQSRLQDELSKLGFRGEARQFQPHLTIGKVKGHGDQCDPRFLDELATLSDYPGGATDVNEIVLFSSTQTRYGPSYEPLGDAPLLGE